MSWDVRLALVPLGREPLPPYVPCPHGCGFSHRKGDPTPWHSVAWLYAQTAAFDEAILAMAETCLEGRRELPRTP